MIITALTQPDYDQWLPLWLANMENSVADDVTAETWRRICDPGSVIGGIGVRPSAQSPLCGICHFILHPTTGNLRQVCYMQDLYIDPDHRRKGMARALVNRLASMGKSEDWARIYWLAEADNEAAQALYRGLGLKLNFTLHVLPL